MMAEKLANIGVVGMAVMGKNLALTLKAAASLSVFTTVLPKRQTKLCRITAKRN